MIEGLISALKEVNKEVQSSIKDIIPSFAKNIESKSKSFEEADKPLNKISTRNESLEGSKHPITDVPYESKVVEVDGEKKEGVFPQFESKMDVDLPEDMYDSSDAAQFKYANEKLKEAIENDPELRKQFTKEQIEDIMDGDIPEGYTWHHSEDTGKLQLVDKETHAKTGHTGGRNIWGGGTENR